MKYLFLILIIGAFACTKSTASNEIEEMQTARGGKDKEAPVIGSVYVEEGYVVSYGQSSIYVFMEATDNVGVYQKI